MNYFNVNNPTNIVTILKDDNNFVHLSDGTMVKKDKFLAKYQPVIGETAINESMEIKQPQQPQQPQVNSDEIDPASFFSQSAVSEMTDTFKNADTNQFNENRQTNIIKNGMPSNTQQPINNPTNSQNSSSSDGIVTIKQDPKLLEIEQIYENEKFAYGEEEANKRRLGRIAQHQGIGQKKETNTQVNINGQEQVQTNTQITQQQIDPSEMMFKSFKRNFDIDINITIKDKIANPDFVKMMMENMNGDIIGYYKKIIMNNILGDVQIIENEVEKSIKKAIYGDDIHEEETNDNNLKEAIDVSNALQEQIDNGEEITSLIEGEPTKTGKKTFKYIDDKGKIKDLLPETAKKKGYKPYIKEKK